MSDSVSQWLSQWVSHWVSQWISESAHESVSESAMQWVSELVSEWVSESVGHWVSRWISVSVSQWVSPSFNTSFNRWRTLLRKKIKIIDTGVERLLIFRSLIKCWNLRVCFKSLIARTNLNIYSQDLREFCSKVATGFCYRQEKAKQIKEVYIITKSMRALWLVSQLWVIVPVNPRKKSRVFWIII